jgi:hypothetical protein
LGLERENLYLFLYLISEFIMNIFRILIGLVIALIAIYPNQSMSQTLQSDTSDTYWKVVLPIPSSQNVVMGQCLLGDSKDSLVKGFVSNIGSYKFRVDSIYITGPDASAFKLISGIPKYELTAGAGKTTEFSFTPNKIGFHYANIIIITQTDTLNQTILGEGVQIQLNLISDILDFGKIWVGVEKIFTDTVVIKNISSIALNINNVVQLGPDKTQFEIVSGGGSFTLQPNESRKITIKFKPIYEGRTSGELGFEYNGFGSPAKVQLFGEGIKITPQITTNSPICQGDDLLLFADSIPNAKYFWYGPGFTSNLQNPIIKKAQANQSGTYHVYSSIGNFISDTTAVDIIINANLISPGDSSLMFVGTASKIDDYIKLTDPKIWDGGSIWLKNRFSVKQDFATTFKFRTRYGNDNKNEDGSIPGADGIAFVMQNHNYPVLGVKGGSMGYTGITNSMAIEFDLYKNLWDPNGNHIAVQSMGAEANQPDHNTAGSCLGITDQIITVKQDLLYFAKIEYDWASKTLRVYLDSTGSFISPSLIIQKIDLANYLKLEEGEYVYIGITSGTGESFQEHDIFDWTIPCKNQLVNDVENNQQTNNSDDLIIYPNPANNKIFISLKENINKNGNYLIYDFLGKFVTEGIIYSGSKELVINTEMIQSGIYSLVLDFPNDVKRMKLIINK